MQKEQGPKTMDTWLALRDALRRLRGMNLWRGNEIVLLKQQQVRLMQEARGDRSGYKHVVIHLTSTPETLWAEEFPGGRRWSAETDFAGDWEAWLQAVVGECRGAAYMHTQSDRAEYRHTQPSA